LTLTGASRGNPVADECPYAREELQSRLAEAGMKSKIDGLIRDSMQKRSGENAVRIIYLLII